MAHDCLLFGSHKQPACAGFETKPSLVTNTLEYKVEAVQLIQGGQACFVTAKVPGIPKQTPDYISPMQFEHNWFAAQLRNAA